MSERVLIPCCAEMEIMLSNNLIQWKQKMNFLVEGVYFTPPEITRYGSSIRRCGPKIKKCPYCPEVMPQTAKELVEFNQRQKEKYQAEPLVIHT